MIKSLKRIIGKLPGPQKQVKNTYYTELLEAFSKQKCPVCLLLEDSVEKYLENLLHEFTMDPVSRRQIRYSFGYCARHTKQLIKVAQNTNQRLSASIVAEDLANTFLNYCRNAAGTSILKKAQIKKVPDCPICLYFSRHERLYISEFARGTQKRQFLDKYSKNPRLCMDHLIGVSRLIKNRGILEKILEPGRKEIEILDTDLNNFINQFNRAVCVFILTYSVLLLLFIYSFSLLFLLCNLLGDTFIIFLPKR